MEVKTESQKGARRPFPVRPGTIFWFLPLYFLGAVIAVHALTGARTSAQVYYGAPIVGFVAAAICLWWSRRIRRAVEGELERRTRDLDDSQAFLRKMVDSSPDAILITNLTGVVTFANKTTEGMFGYGPGELIGESATDLHREGDEAVLELRLRLHEGEGRISAEREVMLHRDGSELPVSLSVSFIEGPDGNPIGMMSVMQDLTDRVTVEDKELRAERLRLLGECVAGIAHELNNPLTGVVGYLQLATKYDAPREIRDAVRKASNEAGRMTNTIRSLLGFARGHEAERVPTDLNDVVGQVIAFLHYQLSVTDVTLGIEAQEMPLALVDPHQVRQVLLNLVKNAADALEETGRGGSILIRTARMADGFRIEVQDDGPGVPEDVAEHIFEDFFTTKPSGRGTGLGLSICRQIALSHGGTIRLAPSEGPGARFVLDLPVPSQEKEEEPLLTARRLPSGLRILVVDDEEAVRDYVAEVLREDGLEVLEAGSGEDALRIVREQEADLVLLDLQMPDMSGEDCARSIAELRPGLERRVVFMSGDRCAPAGEAGFLLKPMSPEEILEVAARSLESAGARR
ncbi:MAG: hybrid sensor histidine kinase/response regulator [Planctomycetota bacterium]